MVREIPVAVIGAGPIGIELAIALKRQGVDYVHIEAAQVGSTISWYAPQTHFFSSPERIEIAGVPLQTLDQTKATREEYLNYLRAVVLQFDLQIRLGERVTALQRRSDGGFDIVTSRVDGIRQWRAKRVVLAIGDMHRPRLVRVPGESLPHVSHYFSDPHTYFRRRVVVVGGRNSAIEAAIRCVRVGADVTLAFRAPEIQKDHIKFWLYPEVVGMERNGRLRILASTVVREIRDDVVILQKGSETIEVPADCVLLLTGYVQDPDLFEQAGVTLTGPGRVPSVNERTMETNVPGLYVAGTAVAGTQSFGVKEFIETSHVHVDRILAAITGEAVPEREPFEVPET